MKNRHSHIVSARMRVVLTLTQSVFDVHSGHLQWGVAFALRPTTTQRPPRRIVEEEAEEAAKCPETDEHTSMQKFIYIIPLNYIKLLNTHSNTTKDNILYCIMYTKAELHNSDTRPIY